MTEREKQLHLAEKYPNLAFFDVLTRIADSLEKFNPTINVVVSKIDFPAFPDIKPTDLTETNALLSQLIEIMSKGKKSEDIQVKLKLE